MPPLGSIHLQRPLPPALATSIMDRFSSLATVTLAAEVSPDTTVYIGDPGSLPSGPSKLTHLRLLIVPFAGPVLTSATRDVLGQDYPSLFMLTLHHNATATAEMAVSLMMAAAKQVNDTLFDMQQPSSLSQHRWLEHGSTDLE